MIRETEERLRSGMERESAGIETDERLWAAAVSRGQRLRRRRRVVGWLGLGAAATVAAVAVGVVGERFGQGHDEPAGSAGVSETAPPVPGKPQQNAVVLDTIRLTDGRRVDLAAVRDGAGPCLQIIGIDHSVRECGRAPSERVPPVSASISAESIAQRDPSSPLEIYGATRSDVVRVEVEYRDGSGQMRSRSAYILHATSSTTLAQAGISDPFNYFFAELPAATAVASVDAVAIGPADRRLGSVDYSMFHDQPLDSFISGPSRR